MLGEGERMVQTARRDEGRVVSITLNVMIKGDLDEGL